MTAEHMIPSLSLNELKSTLPELSAAREIADLFKILSEPNRLRIIYAIFHSGGISVSDLTETTGLNQPAVSQHLKILRQAGIVTFEKQGKHTIYSLTYDHIMEVYGHGLHYMKTAVRRNFHYE